jgi:hypothetical protein
MGNITHNKESPIISKISFFKIFESLEKMAANKNDKHLAAYARELLVELEPYSILREGFTDLSLLEKYRVQITKLSNVLFPELLLNNEIKGLMPPFGFSPFYTSSRFTSIIKSAGPDYKLEIIDTDEDVMHKIYRSAILNMYYNFHVDFSRPYILEIPDLKTGRIRYYRMAFNIDLMEAIPTDKAVKITEKDFHQLIDNYDNSELWKEKFPPSSWIIRGIGLMNLMDVTMDHSIASITSSLIVKTNNTFEEIQDNIRTLFNIEDLEVGYVAFENDRFFQTHKKGNKSLILHNDKYLECENSLCTYNYEKLIEKSNPLAISDLEIYYKKSGASMAKILLKQGIKSYLIIPLIYENKVQGFLEIASRRKRELNTASIHKIKDILPTLAMAAARFQIDMMNQIEAIIQQECTTIHESVKWKFEKEASRYIMSQQEGLDPVFKDITFKNIYPLYGQMDIKGSSTRRNTAVITDLVTQLKGVKKILIRAEKSLHLPAYEELIFRVDTYINDISEGLLAGSEHSILSFLRSEIYPVFDYLKKSDDKLVGTIEKYSQKLNKDTGVIYEARRDFDESVMKANHMMASFIDEKQEEAQKMFPHYFERYKTDGIEYNMYIGQSINTGKTFDQLFLRNLRLWQLMVMCQMENEFMKLQQNLKVKLEVASLILVYNTPLSIHFRMDEKKFDVEGAYNARYEIVKKRVDKANIKNTSERITCPGKIAIIYSNDQDKLEYRKYIDFLITKGYLKEDSLEECELQDLQGITGLKALRVEVNYSNTADMEVPVTYDELIKSL